MWKPIVDSIRARADRQRVAAWLRAHASSARGLAAIDVALLAQHADLDIGEDPAERLTRGLQEELGSTDARVPESTFSGRLGAGWALAILSQAPWGELEAEALLLEFDRLAVETLAHDDRPPAGARTAAGTALGYLLERARQGAVDDAWMTTAIDRLERDAVFGPDGIALVTAPRWLPPLTRPEHPQARYDLGMAAGTAGAVALLTTAVEQGHRSTRCTELLDGLVHWLMHQLEHHLAPPCWVEPLPGGRTGPTHLGWCSGAAGIVASLVHAATVQRRADRRERALAAAERLLVPAPPDQVDGSLCHGAAGIAHVLNRLQHATQRAGLRRLAEAWLERCRQALESDMASPSPRLDLGGTLGAAFALLSAGSERWPRWDTRLLLDRGTTP